MAEVLPGYAMTSWTALIGPANMKTDLVAQVNALIIKALADRGLQERYADLGATPWPASSAEISKFRDDEEKRLLPIMQAAGSSRGEGRLSLGPFLIPDQATGQGRRLSPAARPSAALRSRRLP